MYELYLRNLEGAYRAGVHHFNLWGWVAPDDTWANTNTAVDFDHPKYRAAAEFAARTAPKAAKSQAPPPASKGPGPAQKGTAE